MLKIKSIEDITLSVISFEKNDPPLAKIRYLKKNNINWNYYKFTNKTFFLIKSIDFVKILFLPIFFSLKNNIHIIHCRGHLSSMSGLILRTIFQKKFIFDCRGLWADERVDNNSWQMEKIFFKIIFKFFKYLEKCYLNKSDHIIVLTNNIKNVFINNHSLKDSKISVIPCVADFDKFKILKSEKIIFERKKYKLSHSNFVMGYFGSISNIYMPNKLIDFFLISKKYIKSPKIIFFSDNFEYLIKHVSNFKLLNKNDYYLISPSETQLSKFYNLCDLTLCFVTNSFARKASSPTKIGESLACGVPVLCNKNVGDINDIIPKIYKNGLLNINNKIELNNIASKLFTFKKINKKKIRNISQNIFNLNRVSNIYLMIYKNLINY